MSRFLETKDGVYRVMDLAVCGVCRLEHKNLVMHEYDWLTYEPERPTTFYWAMCPKTAAYIPITSFKNIS